MAQRYGGKFSPDGKPQGESPGKSAFSGARRTRAGGRVNLLFLAPLPLAWSAFTSGSPVALGLNLLALGLLLLAAWTTREGIKAQEAYEARRIARRPALPRKMLASVLTGLGLGLAGFAAGGGLLGPLIYAGLGAALHFLAFGPDPLRDKGMEGGDSFQSDRVARAVEAAEKELSAMSQAIRRAQDRQMIARVERFQATARDLFRTVEEDPRDLTAARRFMSVYLVGAKDATIKFADIHTRNRDPEARRDYLSLLDDLEENFARRTRKLLEDDRTDLTVEIEVLRDRLAREGVRPR